MMCSTPCCLCCLHRMLWYYSQCSHGHLLHVLMYKPLREAVSVVHTRCITRCGKGFPLSSHRPRRLSLEQGWLRSFGAVHYPVSARCAGCPLH